MIISSPLQRFICNKMLTIITLIMMIIINITVSCNHKATFIKYSFRKSCYTPIMPSDLTSQLGLSNYQADWSKQLYMSMVLNLTSTRQTSYTDWRRQQHHQPLLSKLPVLNLKSFYFGFYLLSNNKFIVAC